VEQALALVPTLLPICGEAQSVAASRAVEAARGLAPDADTEREREKRLWREQAFSAGWRLSVDWPDLLGEERRMGWLRTLRNCRSDTECAAVLADALPGTASVATVDELLAWVARGEGTAARLLRRALDEGSAASAGPAGSVCLADASLADLARSLMEHERFDPLAPGDSPVEVGALAMCRDPLVAEIRKIFGATPVARLLALTVDARAIAAGLEGAMGAGQAGPLAWREGEGSGTGCAVTARGPVFHRVGLDERGRVLQWRALAPTDWHFAPRGPVAGALSGVTSLPAARLAVAGFDPCAPWSVQIGGEA